MRTIRRTISKYSRLWDLQRNLRQTDPAGTRRRGQRPAVNDLSEDMREKPDNLYEAIAARGEGAAGAHPETPSSFVRDNPHEKTVCKRFATVFVSFDALRHLRIFEPKPRFNFAALVLSLLLAAGALSKMRKSLCDKRTETKKTAFKLPLSGFPFRSCACGAFAVSSRNRDLNSGPLHYE